MTNPVEFALEKLRQLRVQLRKDIYGHETGKTTTSDLSVKSEPLRPSMEELLQIDEVRQMLASHAVQIMRSRYLDTLDKEAQIITRALAATDPGVYVDTGRRADVLICGVCKKEDPGHDPGCAWRMAQEWVSRNPEAAT